MVYLKDFLESIKEYFDDSDFGWGYVLKNKSVNVLYKLKFGKGLNFAALTDKDAEFTLFSLALKVCTNKGKSVGCDLKFHGLFLTRH